MAPCKITRLGLQDIFPESGDNELLFSKYGMNTENIKSAVKEALKTGEKGEKQI